VNLDAGNVFLSANELDRAISVVERTLEMYPNYPGAHLMLGSVHLLKSNYEKAITEIQIEIESSPSSAPITPAMLGVVLAQIGKRNECLQIREDLFERSKREYVPPYLMAILSFALGERDRGFEWLDKAYEAHDVQLSNLKNHLSFDLFEVHSDPRSIAMLKKIGLDK
jgi:tetratricopeptide (TPR) repeat protein